MKKLLLLFSVLLVSLGVKADPTCTESTVGSLKVLTINSSDGNDYNTWKAANLSYINSFDKIVYVGSFTGFTALQENITARHIDVCGVTNIYGSRQLTNTNIKSVTYSPSSGSINDITTNGTFSDLILVQNKVTVNNASTGYQNQDRLVGKASLTNEGVLAEYMSLYADLEFDVLTVSGPLATTDAAGINAKAVDVQDTELADGALASITGGRIEYMALPYGTEQSTMMSINSNCPNIKVVGAYAGSQGNKDNTSFTAQSFSSNQMKTFLGYLFPEVMDNERNNSENESDWYPTSLTLGGYLGEKDLCDGDNKVFPSKALHTFDLTEALFDDGCTVSITSSQPYGGTEDPCTGLFSGAAQLSCTTTNALYYMSYYDPVKITMPRTATEIPPCTFSNRNSDKHLKTLIFPEGAHYSKIGFEAFYKNHLEQIKLPGSITEVGDGAFYSQPDMTDFTMEACETTCTFGESVLSGSNNIKHVTLSEGVTNISYMMFNQCASLEEIRIPNSCTSIGSYAFQLCFSLHSLTIPRGMQSLGHQIIPNAGVKDIYLLAETPDEVPFIYAVPDGEDCPLGTFGDQNINGNDTDPKNGTREHKDLCHVGREEALTWYQEELSGSAGLGTGRCLALLHFPDAMRDFYDGMGTPAEQIRWKKSLAQNTKLDQDILKRKIELMESMDDGHQWISDGYGYGSQEYDKEFNWNKGNSDVSLITGCDHQHECSLTGCTENGGVCSDDCELCEELLKWPVQTDFTIRRTIGAVGSLDDNGNPVQTQTAWKQFPLMTGVAEEDKRIIPLQYDDTWYTMCFPWHLTDNQLFEAFNQKCEITEFVGAEMIDQTPGAGENDDKVYDLVFHFDDVAKTYYMDKNDIYYDREFQEQRQATVAGVSIMKNYYSYYELDKKDGNRTDVVVTDPADYDEKTDPINNPDKAEQHVRYLSIQNIIPLSCHPYMIHPSVGASPGTPTTCNLVAVEDKMSADEWNTTNQAVTKVATIDDQKMVNGQNKGGQTPFVNPFTNGGGSYTFIGNVGKESDSDEGVDETTGNKAMPTPAYFLAVAKTGEETVTVTDYETRETTVYEADGITPVYVYTYVGKGNGNVKYVFADEHYDYVGAGNGDYQPTAFQPVTTRTDTYDYNTSAFTYQSGGNYSPESYVLNTGNGAYNKTADAYYQHTNSNQGNYKATAFEQTSDNDGEYSGSQPYDYYSYDGWGNYDVISAEAADGGAYNEKQIYLFTENGDGDYDGIFESGSGADCCYYQENGQWKYNQYGWQTHKVTGYTPNASGTGNFKVKTIYEWVGPGNGSYDVTFDTGQSPYSTTLYTLYQSNLNYSYDKTGNWKVTEFTEVGDNKGDWNYIPDQYSYVGSGGNYDVATFKEVENGQGSYVKNGVEYVYNTSGSGAYEPYAWSKVNDGEGAYTYTPEQDDYVSADAGECDYLKSEKKVTETVETGSHQETRATYAKYPKYYRKSSTSGYKWSKYSAIIKPDADAIANIESYINAAAAGANGFNVAFGEWEEVTPTAIDEIVAEAERNNEPVQKIHLNVVYNVKGQVVRTGNGSLEGLPKGLYIVNGKKYMVK